MGLKILQPGVLTTVQDAGRFGHQAAGFSVSGPMDTDALYTANILVNNPPDYACLEMVFQGAAVVFDRKTYFALTGADMSPTLNGAPIPMYRAIEVKAGDTLVCSVAKQGKYTYLAVAGGIDVPVVMGSRATNLKCAIGGYQGRKLAFGDELPLAVTGVFLDNHYRKHLEPPVFSNEITLRVVPGPQDELFTDRGKQTFLSGTYTMQPDSDRMGIRLSGPEIESTAGVDIISDAIAFGSIQIPSSGQPIILMADRQTTGGYAKIGTIISPDLPKLAQCTAGAKIHFQWVTAAEANRLYRQHQKQLRRLARKTGLCLKKW